MGIASLVIGIVSALLGFIPLCNYFAVIPALVGLVLGVVDIVLKGKKQLPKGMGIAGVALNGLAMIIILVWTLVIGTATTGAASAFQDALTKAQQEAAKQAGSAAPSGAAPAPGGAAPAEAPK